MEIVNETLPKVVVSHVLSIKKRTTPIINKLIKLEIISLLPTRIFSQAVFKTLVEKLVRAKISERHRINIYKSAAIFPTISAISKK
ncbi:hypothetical protein [Fournierella sp.]|uniref:hypothetical protein n=1 Tax=Allofournierella sp. TaxID=1940256 RepID=UPI0025BB59D1|nr:hypothetical protein [Fournierella sp.]